MKQKEKLAALIADALDSASQAGLISLADKPAVSIEVPRDTNHGDFASNIAMVLAKPLKMAPRQIAQHIVEYLTEDSMIEKVEIAGPGFLNFYLRLDWLHRVLAAIEEQGVTYGNSTSGQGERVLLEFVSANPVGPMNVVNARAAAIGDSLTRIMEAAGFVVASEYYVNDAGNQTQIFARSLEARLLQIEDPSATFPDDGYPGDYVTDLAVRLHSEHPEVVAMASAERQEFCRSWGIDQMVAAQKEDLRSFNVEFDVWFREHRLHQTGALGEVMSILDNKGLLYESEGALWFRSQAFGDDKDRVIRKSDGAYTYVTADIAYHYDKLKRGFTKLIDLLGPDHHGYIGRMRAAVQALGYPADTLEVLILQYVSLLRDGQQVKMSKRAGEFITLQDVVDEVGRDAARFFFLMRSMESHLDFDLTLASEQSSENPVFYVQYAHARICSILKQAEDVGARVLPVKDVDLSLLQHTSEAAVLRKLAELPEEIAAAAEYREPHRVARYALDLAGLFHAFYTHCHVLGEAEDLKHARLALVNSVGLVLRRVLTLLGVSAPESM